jgi:hypothetical protein
MSAPRMPLGSARGSEVEPDVRPDGLLDELDVTPAPRHHSADLGVIAEGQVVAVVIADRRGMGCSVFADQYVRLERGSAVNHLDWYVNDVLYYADRYGGGTVRDDPNGERRPKAAIIYQRTCRHGPRLRESTTVTATGWARPGKPPGTAPASPKPATPRSASRCPAPPPRNAPGLPPVTAPASNPAKRNRRPDLLGLLPRTQPDRARHDHLESSQETTIEARGTRQGVGHLSYADGPSHPRLQNLAGQQSRRPSLISSCQQQMREIRTWRCRRMCADRPGSPGDGSTGAASPQAPGFSARLVSRW